MFSEKEREELRQSARSEALRYDLERVAASRHDPFGGKEPGADALNEFLSRYNEFLNHPMKPFEPFIEKNMKL